MKKLVKYSRYACVYFFEYLLYVISYLVPKSKKIWIFGAWAGNAYCDNTKYIYEYASSKKDISAYWVSKDKEVINSIISRGGRAYYYYSLKGILIAMRASIVFITQTHADVNFYCCARAKVINCWHGIMMKKVLFDVEDFYNSSNWGTKISYRYLPFTNVISPSDYVVCTGKMYKQIVKSAFKVDDSHVFYNGYPRNDILFKKREIPKTIKESKDSGAKVVIYLPTHRNFGKSQFCNPLDNLAELNELLKEKNIIMYCKPHFHERKRFLVSEDLSNIRIIDEYNYWFDINSYLNFFDALITDYSGAYFDYLLTNKPVVFFNYDMQWYEENDYGLYFNYEDIAMGEKADNWKDVLDCLVKELNDDSWKEKREKIRDEVFFFIDDRSAERAFKFAYDLVYK